MKHVAPLLARLEETATVLGTIVIDGYRAERDWLRLEQLFGALPSGQGTRVIWFGVDEAPEHALVQELVSNGTLVLESRRLAAVVGELRASGELADTGLERRNAREVISLGGDRLLDVPPALRLRVEASAAVVDDEWTELPTALSPSATMDAFQRFHGDPGGARVLVEGVLRGFAIERPFERRLRDRVDAQLARRDEFDRVVLIHGQSGTGKTLACARFVSTIRRNRKLPVLFAFGRVPPPTDVDDFCLLAEQSGAHAVLVVCDANAAPTSYVKLADALRSRGRRAIVVGTTYRTEDASHLPADLVEAPAEAGPTERTQVIELVRKYSDASEAALTVLREEDAASVFALLYRVLAYGRERLVSGVSGEARAAEDFLRRRASTKPARMATQLAKALVTAGLHAGSLPLFEGEADALFGRDAPGRLIDTVMAVGRLGLFTPVSLLMRALRARWQDLSFSEIAVMFRDLDLFRWRLDREGSEVLVGPRLQLEAEVIAKRRLGGVRRELECIIEVISSVRSRGVDGSAERNFLFDLLQRLDRRGPRGDDYSSGYLAIAETLTQLRQSHALDDVSFMLKESGFRRDHLFIQDDAVDAAERDRVLNDARSIVDGAIRRVEAGELRASPRARQDLFVERAALYGYLAVGHARRGDAVDVVWSDYQAARAASRKAIASAPSYYPYDIGLWTTADLLSDRVVTQLNDAQRAELRADIYALLDQVSVNEISTDQAEKYLRRKDRVGGVLGDEGLSLEARAALMEINPAVATYLEARELAGPAIKGHGEPLSAAARASADAALAVLVRAGDVAGHDARCLALQLELAWIGATGERLLRSERRPIPANERTRDELLRLVRALRAENGGVLDYRLRFLETVLSWLGGDVRGAEEAWRALGRETEFEVRGRPNRRLFVADESGRPVRFRGRLVRQRNNERWVVEVESLRGTVDLMGGDFRGSNLTVGYAAPEFAVAFNYLGPIADPLMRYEVRP